MAGRRGIVRPVSAAGTVVATGTFPADRDNVQAAVNGGGVVYLQNGPNGEEFDFGPSNYGNWVMAASPVEIIGQNATINNGFFGFLVFYTNNVKIRNITFKNTGHAPVYGGNSTNCVIEGNTMINPTRGIYIPGCDGWTISNNTITGAKDNGIRLGRAGNCTVSGNTISNTVGSNATSLEDAHGLIFTGNTITGTPDRAIYLKDTSNFTLSGNTVNGAKNGIRVWRDNLPVIENGIISNNNITNCGQRGIHMYGRSKKGPKNCTVSGNTITNCGRQGVHMQNSPDTTITGNQLESIQQKSIDLSGSPRCTVSGNAITNGTQIAIYVKSSDDCPVSSNNITNINDNCPITGNTLTQVSKNGIDVGWDSTNCTVQGNTITNVGWSGIFISRDASNCAVSDNIFNEVHGSAGIDCKGDSNTFYNNDFGNSGIMGLKNGGTQVCVLLSARVDNGIITAIPANNFVKEQGNYPVGTGAAKFQILDAWADLFEHGDIPPYPAAGDELPNRIVGHDQGTLAQQYTENPGIGQLISALNPQEPLEPEDPEEPEDLLSQEDQEMEALLANLPQQ
jgi:parallel beta-helix repeat protein